MLLDSLLGGKEVGFWLPSILFFLAWPLGPEP